MSLEARVRIIPHMIAPASENMAIDHSLLDLMERKIKNGEEVNPIIRTYRFQSPSVVFGFRQKVDGSLNHDLAKKMKVRITTRESGGGHMYFSPEDIHFCFISPEGWTTNNFDLTERYQRVNSVIAEALKELGYDARVGRTSIKINEEEKIIAGTAIRQRNGVYMHQGGILVDKYDDQILSLLMASDEEIENWRTRVTSLKENGNGAYRNLPEKIVSLFPNGYVEPLTKEEKDYAYTLHDRKFFNLQAIYSGNKVAGICLVAEHTKDKDNIKPMEAIIGGSPQ